MFWDCNKGIKSTRGQTHGFPNLLNIIDLFFELLTLKFRIKPFTLPNLKAVNSGGQGRDSTFT